MREIIKTAGNNKNNRYQTHNKETLQCKIFVVSQLAKSLSFHPHPHPVLDHSGKHCISICKPKSNNIVIAWMGMTINRGSCYRIVYLNRHNTAIWMNYTSPFLSLVCSANFYFLQVVCRLIPTFSCMYQVLNTGLIWILMSRIRMKTTTKKKPLTWDEICHSYRMQKLL